MPIDISMSDFLDNAATLASDGNAYQITDTAENISNGLDSNVVVGGGDYLTPQYLSANPGQFTFRFTDPGLPVLDTYYWGYTYTSVLALIVNPLFVNRGVFGYLLAGSASQIVYKSDASLAVAANSGLSVYGDDDMVTVAAGGALLLDGDGANVAAGAGASLFFSEDGVSGSSDFATIDDGQVTLSSYARQNVVGSGDQIQIGVGNGAFTLGVYGSNETVSTYNSSIGITGNNIFVGDGSNNTFDISGVTFQVGVGYGATIVGVDDAVFGSFGDSFTLSGGLTNPAPVAGLEENTFYLSLSSVTFKDLTRANIFGYSDTIALGDDDLVGLYGGDATITATGADDLIHLGSDATYTFAAGTAADLFIGNADPLNHVFNFNLGDNGNYTISGVSQMDFQATVRAGVGDSVTFDDAFNTLAMPLSSFVYMPKGGKVTLLEGSRADVIGSGVTVNLDGRDDGIDRYSLPTNDVLGLYGDNNTVTLAASNDFVYMGFGSQTLNNCNGETLVFYANFSATVDGGYNLLEFDPFIASGEVKGVVDSDTLQFSKSDFADFAALQAAMTQSGGDTIISVNGHTLTLDGVSATSITAVRTVFA